MTVDGTRVQVFLDHEPVPVFDYPVVDFLLYRAPRARAARA